MTIQISELTNNRRRMKPRANSIQHLNPPLQQLKIQGIPIFYSNLSNALKHHGDNGHQKQSPRLRHSVKHRYEKDTKNTLLLHFSNNSFAKTAFFRASSVIDRLELRNRPSFDAAARANSASAFKMVTSRFVVTALVRKSSVKTDLSFSVSDCFGFLQILVFASRAEFLLH